MLINYLYSGSQRKEFIFILDSTDYKTKSRYIDKDQTVNIQYHRPPHLGYSFPIARSCNIEWVIWLFQAVIFVVVVVETSD